MFQKCKVNGAEAHEVFKFLRINSKLNAKGKVKEVPWSFTKFLVNREGQVEYYFDPRYSLYKMTDEIEKMLTDQ